jgi:hypothetical protein
MATLFTVGSGITFLTINSAAGGANVVVSNPDATQTTFFLTTAQVRQLALAVASALATSGVSNPSIAGSIVVGTTLGLVGTLGQQFGPPQMTAITIAVPLAGTGAGQNYTQSLTLAQAQQLVNAILLYSVQG